MLDTQYRMHPTISRFPSHEFYDRALLDGTVDASGNVVPGLIPPQSLIFPELQAMLNVNTDLENMGAGEGEDRRPSVVFLDHVGNESAKDRSKVNWNEAHIVCSLIEDLLLRNPVRFLSASLCGAMH